MKININGKKADIVLENEKTAGDILAALEGWLANSGHRLSGLAINGSRIDSNGIEAFFRREIDSIETLDIFTSSIVSLLDEALTSAALDAEAFENAGFEERQAFSAQWKESPQALLLSEQCPEIFRFAEKTFSGEGPGCHALRAMLEERQRELRDPTGELERAGPVLSEVCSRLEGIPLDIQTGKDSRAAETVQIFSNIAEKILRLFNILKAEGGFAEDITVENVPVSGLLGEFGAAVQEMLAAYQQHDAVLTGDLAEYELAPRLRNLYAAISGQLCKE